MFDSIFSVEVVGNDVYIGGHFRALVSDTAPSPYPGAFLLQNGGNEFTYDGETVAFESSQAYEADPELDPNRGGSVRFHEDLFDPGFAFAVNQFGELDARTGYGNPNFDPGSNAQVGVLAITAIDRGLLLGQDLSLIHISEPTRPY